MHPSGRRHSEESMESNLVAHYYDQLLLAYSEMDVNQLVKYQYIPWHPWWVMRATGAVVFVSNLFS